MSETAFYILLSLRTPMHGYGIIQHVAMLTRDRLVLGAGTLYGTLKKMQAAGKITLVDHVAKRKVYVITPAGLAALQAERARLVELVRNSEGLDEDT